MSGKYYKLPLNFNHFFETGSFEKCSELVSIDQHIELLLTTCPGEHRFDVNFGCEIWLLDFDHNSTTNKWKKLFHDYVMESIVTYEKRISRVVVNINITEVVRSELSDRTTIRRRVEITVEAVLNSTKQNCYFGYNIFLGPITNQ